MFSNSPHPPPPKMLPFMRNFGKKNGKAQQATNDNIMRRRKDDFHSG
jgi:hypothetical protein